MELETINKLYLELSQFATAKTAREIELEQILIRARFELYRTATKTVLDEFDALLAKSGIMP